MDSVNVCVYSSKMIPLIDKLGGLSFGLWDPVGERLERIFPKRLTIVMRIIFSAMELLCVVSMALKMIHIGT